MSLAKKTKDELIAIINADRDVVRRARQAMADLQAERERRQSVEKQIKELKAQPPKERIVKETVRVQVPVEKIVEKKVRVEVPVEKIVEKVVRVPVETIIEKPVRVEVPVSDPRQAAEIEALRARLDAINWDDVREAKEYRRRMNMAGG